MANLLAYGADVVGGFAERPPVIYSTDEQVIGEWIDGSTLYQKTIEVGALPSSAGSKTVAHGITNIDKIVSVQGTTARTNKTTLPLPMSDLSSLSGQIVAYADATNVYVFVGINQSVNVETYVTLRYTKSS